MNGSNYLLIQKGFAKEKKGRAPAVRSHKDRESESGEEFPGMQNTHVNKQKHWQQQKKKKKQPRKGMGLDERVRADPRG